MSIAEGFVSACDVAAERLVLEERFRHRDRGRCPTTTPGHDGDVRLRFRQPVTAILRHQGRPRSPHVSAGVQAKKCVGY